MTNDSPTRDPASIDACSNSGSRWLGPIRIPSRMTVGCFERSEQLAQCLKVRYRWFWYSMLAGAFPVLAAYWTEYGTVRSLSAILLAFPLIAAVTSDSLVLVVGTVGLGIMWHSMAMISLAIWAPDAMSDMFPRGAAYWDTSYAWILTGHSEEYDVGWWLPAHLQLLGAVCFFSYVSFGFITLWHGFIEIDMMNAYVGRLIAHSTDTVPALLLGWHPWSICRGIGYLLITFEVTSYSIQRMTGRPLSTPICRRKRWIAGLSFLAMDGIIKFTVLETVRQVLRTNLG